MQKSKKNYMNRKYPVHISNTAYEDISEIGKYILLEFHIPKTSFKIIGLLEKRIATLENFPYRHQLVMDSNLASLGIRSIKEGNYIIFYIIRSNEIYVLRVLYNRRNWKIFL